MLCPSLVVIKAGRVCWFKTVNKNGGVRPLLPTENLVNRIKIEAACVEAARPNAQKHMNLVTVVILCDALPRKQGTAEEVAIMWRAGIQDQSYGITKPVAVAALISAALDGLQGMAKSRKNWTYLFSPHVKDITAVKIDP